MARLPALLLDAIITLALLGRESLILLCMHKPDSFSEQSHLFCKNLPQIQCTHIVLLMFWATAVFTCHDENVFRHAADRNVDIDYRAFLQVCFMVGTKMPPDMMPHYVTGVGRNRILSWASDIRLACATAEFVDSQEITFEPGLLEFDTAATAIARKPTKKDVILGITSTFLIT